MPSSPISPSRRSLLRTAVAAGAAAAVTPLARPSLAAAATASILKPLPAEWFVPFGTIAEMRWDSVDPRRYLTDQSRLFIRNHTATQEIDPSTYALRVYGDGLAAPVGVDQPHRLPLDDLRSLPATRLTSTLECTGKGRRFFGTQQGRAASGTQWGLGAVGCVRGRACCSATCSPSLGWPPTRCRSRRPAWTRAS